MIEHHGHELVLKYAKQGCTMLELGNQIMNLADVQGISAKQHFKNLGYKHTSLDQNGKDGALKVNLAEPLAKFAKSFDIITDFGTTEHVSNLYECLKNVYNACQDGTIIIHKNPKTGSFPSHGYHFFTLEFWKEYANICDFDIVELYEHPIYHNTIDGWECIAILKFDIKKTHFPTVEQFNSISHLVKTA